MKQHKPVTKGYIYHRLIELEGQIILTLRALERWRGGTPVELYDIIDSIGWAQRMMKSYQLRQWLAEVDDIYTEYNQPGAHFKNHLTDTELSAAYHQELMSDPDKLKTLKQLKELDEQHGIIPRGPWTIPPQGARPTAGQVRDEAPGIQKNAQDFRPSSE